jgi:gliding motility-associated-like protein
MLASVIQSCHKERLERTRYCDDLITDTLGTGDSCRIYIPYAFTPNGDGVNDLFMPVAYHVKSWQFEIYDNCGERLFYSTQPGQGWNASSRVRYIHSYYYRLQAFTDSNHRIGQCGEFIALDCIPSGFELHQFSFSDQYGYDGISYATNEVIGRCD